MADEEPLLEVQNLTVRYRLSRRRTVTAVRNVGFSVRAGQTLGLVGESGSGKSTIGKSILGLAEPTSGSITFDGNNLVADRRRSQRALSRDLQVIFQDPNSSLNPSRTIGSSLVEPLLVGSWGIGRRRSERKAAEVIARDSLRRVGVPDHAFNSYPSAFSGGQRQRIAIARALVMKPKLIICDEPVSALDLSIQAQVLNLLMELQRDEKIAYLFISHDLSVVRHMCHDVMILRNGSVVEHGASDQIWHQPTHEYTKKLIASVPDPNPRARQEGRAGLRWATSSTA